MANNHVVEGKRTVIKFNNMEKYAIDVRESKFCTIDVNDHRSLGVTMPKGISSDIVASVTMDVWIEGFSALEMTFEFITIAESLEPEMFLVASEPLRMLEQVPVTLHGPVGHSYRIDTKKATGDVLDHEYIRKSKDWTPVGEPVDLMMLIDNGQRTSSLNFVVRSDLRKGNTIKFNRAIKTVPNPTVRAVHTSSSNGMQLGRAHNILVKGGEPILTGNRYIAGIQFGEDAFRLKGVPTKESCNTSTLSNSLGLVINPTLIYDDNPHMYIKSLNLQWTMSILRSIYKNGEYNSHHGNCKFFLEDGDVIMHSNRVPGYDHGPVYVLLRKPQVNCMWRKNESTNFTTDGVKYSIEGARLPNQPYAIRRMRSQSGVLFVKTIASTGFIQVEH